MNETSGNTQEIQKSEKSKTEKIVKKTKKNIFKKVIKWFFIGFFGLIALLYLIVWFFLNPYLKSQLISTIESSTKGLYTMEISSLNLNFFNGSLTIRNVTLKKDLKRWEELNAEILERGSLDLDLEVGVLRVNGIEWWNYLQSSELNIQRIWLETPKIKFKNQQVLKEQKKKSKKDLPTQITDFVGAFAKHLRITSIVIDDALIRLENKTKEGEAVYKADSLNIDLDRIFVGTNPQKKPLDNISLRSFQLQCINGQLVTADNVYQFDFDFLTISSLDSLLKVKNFKTKPMSMLKMNSLNNIKKYKASRYDVALKSLEAYKVDFFRIIYKLEFDLRSLHLVDLKLDAQNDKYVKKDVSKAAKAEGNTDPIPRRAKGLKEILQEIPLYIRLDTLTLQNASVKFTDRNLYSNQVSYHKAEDIYLTFYNIALGKAMLDTSKSRTLYAETVALSLQNYEYKSPDGLYKVFLGKAKVSTSDKIVYVENAYLKPIVSNEEYANRKVFQSLKIDAQVKNLKADNFDLERLAYKLEFAMGSLLLDKPVFEAYLDKTKPKRPTQQYQNFDHVLQTIPIYIDMNVFTIRDAEFAYTEKTQLKDKTGLASHQADHINVQVQNIQLGKALNFSALERVDTKSLLFNLENYEYKSPDGVYKLYLNKLNLSSSESTISIDSLVLNSLVTQQEYMVSRDFRSSLLNISVDNIKGQEIDFKRLLLYQEFDWGYLYLNKPKISVFTDKTKPRKNPRKDSINLRQILKDIPVFIKVDSFIVNDAGIDYREQYAVSKGSGLATHKAEEIDFLIPNITLGKASYNPEDSVAKPVFYSETLFIDLKNYEYKDKDDIYKFTLEDIKSSLADSVLLIEKLKFKPLISEKEFVKNNPYQSLYIDTELQSIRANDIDLERLIFQKEIVLKSLSINQPLLKFYSDKRKPKKPGAKSQTAEELLRAIPIYIRIDTLLLNNGSLKFTQEVANKNGSGTVNYQAEKINLLSRKIELALNKSSQSSDSSNHLLYSKDIRLSLENFEFINADKTYKVSLDKLESVLTDSILQINRLKIKPLHSIAQFDSLYQFQKTRLDMDVEQIKVKTEDFKRFLDNKGYVFHALVLNNVNLFLYKNKMLPKNPTDKPKSPEEIIGDLPYYIDIDTLSLRNAKFIYQEKHPLGSTYRMQTHKADSIMLNFYGLKIDSTAFDDKNRLLFSDDISLTLQNYETSTADDIYGIKMGRLQASSAKSFLSIEAFDMQPLVSDEEFYHIKGFQTERYKISAENIQAKALDFKKMINQNELRLRSLNLDELVVDIYADKRFPSRPNHKPKMPNQSFQQIPLNFKLDTLFLQNSTIVYGEKVPKGVGTGKVFFTDINVQVLNLDKNAQEDAITTIQGDTRLMSGGLLNITLEIPLLSPQLFCNYYGKLGKMDATVLNRMIESNEHVRIKKGEINKVKYKVSLHDTLAQGSLAAGYKHLRLEVLKKEDHKKKRGLITFLANVIVKGRNNLEKRRVKEGKIYYVRKEDDGFFGVLWRSLATGLMDTLK